MGEWPAFSVERWPLARLRPYERNARTHSPRQVGQLRAAMRTYGWTMPILAREDGTVIAGHGRLEAGRAEGYSEAPVIVARGWSDEQCRAYALADNRIAENSTWDGALLGSELAELSAIGIDLQSLGFEALELNGLIGDKRGQGEGDADAPAPSPPAVPATRPGEVWVLGDHRLACGDSTDAATVTAALGGAAPRLMVTDPPYGVNYDPTWRDGADLGVGERSKGKVKNDDRADWREAWALFPGSVAYVWHGGLHTGEVEVSLQAAGLVARAQIIWVKQHFVMSRGDYHWQHEPCWYAVRAKGAKGAGRARHWLGDRKQSTVWEIANNNSFGNAAGKETTWGHGTQKPVECMRRPMLNSSAPGDAVYDPFLGSGTTIIAAEMTRRRCIGLEIEPAYCDVIVKRWQAFTGAAARLDGDGHSFDEIAAERAGAGQEKDTGNGTRQARRARRRQGDEGQPGQAPAGA